MKHLFRVEVGNLVIHIKSIGKNVVNGYVDQDGLKFIEIPKEHLPFNEDMYNEISEVLNSK
tara:strand:- start:7384 stop:7566 length:183 start_codon:yes stop_codon:yes gene_type:complete